MSDDVEEVAAPVEEVADERTSDAVQGPDALPICPIDDHPRQVSSTDAGDDVPFNGRGPSDSYADYCRNAEARGAVVATYEQFLEIPIR